MGAMVEMKVDTDQIKQLNRVLLEFGEKDLQKGTLKAVKESMRPLVRTVQRNTPVGETAALARSIGEKVKQYRNKGVTVGVVGARTGFKRQITGRRGSRRNVDPSNYLHLVELGHRIVTRKVGGGNAGFVKGNPFLQRSLRQAKRVVIIKYSSTLGREAEKAITRAARKIKKSSV